METKIHANARFALRADTNENWEKSNPVLEKGEPAIVTDGTETDKIKFGDGVTPWKKLSYFKGPKGDRGLPGNGSIIDIGNKPIKILAGVIRKNSDNTWSFITDDKHNGGLNCTAVSVVTVDGEEQIKISYPQTSKVVSFTIAPDETFASYGYICGASVSKTAAYVKVYKTVPFGCAGLLTCRSTGFEKHENSVGINSFEWNGTDSYLKISHNDMNEVGDNVTAWVSSNISVVPWKTGKFIPVVTPGVNYFKVEFYGLDGNKITTLSSALSCAVSRTSSHIFERKLLSPTTDINSVGNFWFIGIFEE